MASTPHYPTRRLELQGETGAELLQAMLGSGRCFWQDKDRAPLALGDPRPAGIEWALGEDGYQRLAFVTDEPASEILPLAPPWYLDADKGVLRAAAAAVVHQPWPRSCAARPRSTPRRPAHWRRAWNCCRPGSRCHDPVSCGSRRPPSMPLCLSSP
jgi:hypothetical protein